MLGQELQETQTTQFLKTRLMQRDRQISDFETKTKKIQLKHNRDLKEAKMAEQRAKNLLKDEKTKADKFSKQLKQSQQQINLLNLRLSELFKSKEREVNDIKNLYNSMKEQVRRYERILPTLTFLNQFGLKIEDIPIYQDLFLGLKEKITQLQANNKKFQQYRVKSQQTIKNISQNQQNMRVKKQEIQRSLNDIISKLQECEFQNCQLKIIQAELRWKNNQLQELYEVENQRNMQLQKATKDYESKFEEMQSFYNSQIQNKEEEIRKMAQIEFEKLQHENESLQQKFVMKQKMYLQQIRILQDQVYYLQGRISQEKTNFQENYIQIKVQIERMREEVDKQREAHEQLKERYEQMVISLIKVGRANQQLELKVQNQQRKIDMYEQKQRRNFSPVSDIQISQLKHMQQTYDDLLQRYTHANALINRLKEDNSYLQEEAATLRSQIVSKTTPQNSHILQLPSTFLQFQNLIKNTSNISQAEVENQKFISQDLKRQEALTLQIQKVNQQNKELRQLTAKLEHQIPLLQEKHQKIQNQLLQKISCNQKLTKQLGSLKKQREKASEQIIKLKQKNVQMSCLLSQRQQESTINSRNYQMLQEKLQYLQKNEAFLKDQLKIQKSLQQTLKEQIKILKQTNAEDLSRAKKAKELKYQVQYKKQVEKVRNEWASKENGLNQQIKELKRILNDQSKDKQKIDKINFELSKLRQQKNTIQLNYGKLQKQKNVLAHQKLLAKEGTQKKDREIVNLEQALARERKQRTLLSIPSLKLLDEKAAQQQKQRVVELNLEIKKKDEANHHLERQISDLKEEIQSIKLAEEKRLETIQIQQNYYIQQIIEMKMKCAQSEMKAAQSQHLYNLLKRRNSKANI